MSSHITFVIAKQLLKDKKKEVANRYKGKGKPQTEKNMDAITQEIKAIDEELWLLENW